MLLSVNCKWSVIEQSTGQRHDGECTSSLSLKRLYLFSFLNHKKIWKRKILHFARETPGRRRVLFPIFSETYIFIFFPPLFFFLFVPRWLYFVFFVDMAFLESLTGWLRFDFVRRSLPLLEIGNILADGQRRRPTSGAWSWNTWLHGRARILEGFGVIQKKRLVFVVE